MPAEMLTAESTELKNNGNAGRQIILPARLS